MTGQRVACLRPLQEKEETLAAPLGLVGSKALDEIRRDTAVHNRLGTADGEALQKRQFITGWELRMAKLCKNGTCYGRDGC